MYKLLLTYIYVFFFSLINASILAYSLSDINLFYETCYYAILPSFAISSLLLFFNPFSILAETLLFFVAGIWNLVTIFYAYTFKKQVETLSTSISIYKGEIDLFQYLEPYTNIELVILLFVSVSLPLLPWHFLNYYKETITLKSKFLLILVSALSLLIPMDLGSDEDQAQSTPATRTSTVERNLDKLFYIKYTMQFREELSAYNEEIGSTEE